jgi:hypothetical protein
MTVRGWERRLALLSAGAASALLGAQNAQPSGEGTEVRL